MVNLKPSAFLFAGVDSYLKENAIKELASSLLDNSSRELDYKVFYGGSSDVREILNYANTIPFLASKRLVLIKDFEKMPREDRARLVEYIKKPSRSTCLVLETKDDSSLEGCDMAGYVDVRHFRYPDDSKIAPWIRQYLARKDKRIEDEAIRILKELQGRNLLSLANELDKLAAYIGERADIKASDVEEVTGKDFMASAFDLTKAVGEKDVGGAMRIMSALITAGKSPYEIIGLLCWYLKRVLKARVLRSRGESDSCIALSLRIPRRYADEFFKEAGRLTISEIRSKIEMLLEADLDVKRTRYDPALVLEFAVIRLCLT